MREGTRYDKKLTYELVPTRSMTDYGSIEDEDLIEEEPTSAEGCSITQASCNLVAVITGSGMLSLAFGASSMGYSALIALLILGSISIYSFEVLAKSIVVYQEQFRLKHEEIVDYVILGRFCLGKRGETIVLLIFSIEMLLALTSFFINIGLNLHLVIFSCSVTTGIACASFITAILSMFDMKFASFTSALGLMMTIFTILALIWSGSAFVPEHERVYRIWNPSGFPLSVGLIAFCFGGHATL
jgi:hypothetical protein